jgi:phage-related protein
MRWPRRWSSEFRRPTKRLVNTERGANAAAEDLRRFAPCFMMFTCTYVSRQDESALNAAGTHREISDRLWRRPHRQFSRRAACEEVIRFLETGEIDQRPRHRAYLGNDIWEPRISFGKVQYRILSAVRGGVATLLDGFQKKTQTTPKRRLDLAKSRRKALPSLLSRREDSPDFILTWPTHSIKPASRPDLRSMRWRPCHTKSG